MGYLTAILALCLALAGGYWWTDSTAFDRGYKDRDGKCEAEKVVMKNESLEVERQANAQRDVARLVADGAAQEVDRLKKTLALNSERFNLELNRRASAARMCFSPPVARLLVGADPVPARQPDAAGAAAAGTAPDPAPAAPDAEGSAADQAGTSELAAGRYIDLIRDRFNECRAQLRAVIVGTRNEPID